jgi:hypothetical protein
MSQSRWLFKTPTEEDIKSIALIEHFISSKIFNTSDFYQMHITCFDKCSEKKDFNYDLNCLRNCKSLAQSYLPPTLTFRQHETKFYAVPTFNQWNI